MGEDGADVFDGGGVAGGMGGSGEASLTGGGGA